MYTVKQDDLKAGWGVWDEKQWQMAQCDDEADARRIASALNMEAAMAEVRAALEWFIEFCNEHPDWTENELCNGRDNSAEAEWLNSARAALAALDRAGEV